jgi:hypothetical protein
MNIDWFLSQTINLIVKSVTQYCIYLFSVYIVSLYQCITMVYENKDCIVVSDLDKINKTF